MRTKGKEIKIRTTVFCQRLQYPRILECDCAITDFRICQDVIGSNTTRGQNKKIGKGMKMDIRKGAANGYSADGDTVLWEIEEAALAFDRVRDRLWVQLVGRSNPLVQSGKYPYKKVEGIDLVTVYLCQVHQHLNEQEKCGCINLPGFHVHLCNPVCLLLHHRLDILDMVDRQKFLPVFLI